MKRGIPREVGIQRTITYVYSRALLIEKLGLPADAIIEADGEHIGDSDGQGGELTLKVHCKENVTSRPRVAKADDKAA